MSVWGRGPHSLACCAQGRGPAAVHGCLRPTRRASARKRREPEYVPLKKRRQLEEQQRLARLGRALPSQPTSSADTGGSGGSRGYASEPEVDGHHQRQKESLLVLKAKKLQEVGGAGQGLHGGWRRVGGAERQPVLGLGGGGAASVALAPVIFGS